MYRIPNLLKVYWHLDCKDKDYAYANQCRLETDWISRTP